MDVVQLILFIFPAYAANAAPVLFAGRTPIDMGQQLGDKRRLFGKGKTIRGFIAGVAAGTLTGVILATFVPEFLIHVPFNDKLLFSFLLSLGAMTGDLIGSFVKRRWGMESGRESLVMDKILFAITALILAFPIYNGKIPLEAIDIIVLLILTFILHVAFNRIAHLLKLKKVPW